MAFLPGVDDLPKLAGGGGCRMCQKPGDLDEHLRAAIFDCIGEAWLIDPPALDSASRHLGNFGGVSV